MHVQVAEQPKQNPKKLELLPIDRSKEFGVLMKDGLDLVLSDNWTIASPFSMDDYQKCSCLVVPNAKFAEAVNEIYRAISSWAKDMKVLEPFKDSMVKVSAPRAKGLIKDIRVDNQAEGNYNLVPWENVRDLQPKKALVKVNCYYQNRDGATTIGFFYQLDKLLV